MADLSGLNKANWLYHGLYKEHSHCLRIKCSTVPAYPLFTPFPIQRSVDVGQQNQSRVENNNMTIDIKNRQWLTKFADVAVPILDIVGPFMLKCCGLIYEVKFSATVVLSIVGV